MNFLEYLDNRKITIGSGAFFGCYDDYQPHDRDFIILIENPAGFKNFIHMNSLNGEDIFIFRKMSKDEFIEFTLREGLPMAAGKFLVPEFDEEICFTAEDLHKLEPLIHDIDEKHRYEKTIYDAYIENGGLFLTDEQRKTAYEQYKKYRHQHI